MSLNCGITAGINISCADRKRVSGVARKVWVFNLSDLRVPIDTTTASYVTDLEFNTYRNLYAFEGAKFSHQGSVDLARTDGGNVSFNQTVVLRVFNNDPTDDATIEDLTTSDVGVILLTNNNEFLIFGAGNGLTCTAMTQTTGKNQGEDTTSVLTLTGSEVKMYKRFLKNDYATSLSFLNAMTA